MAAALHHRIKPLSNQILSIFPSEHGPFWCMRTSKNNKVKDKEMASLGHRSSAINRRSNL
jgi:hypothetical protein